MCYVRITAGCLTLILFSFDKLTVAQMVTELAAFYNRSIHYSFHINPPLDSIIIFSELQF